MADSTRIKTKTIMNDRLNELVRLFQILNPDVKIDAEFKVRGSTLRLLAETGAGGYQRVLAWARGKVVEKQSGSKSTTDIAELTKIYKHCLDLMKSRNAKYGDSWRVLTIPATANLIEMKMHRIANMDAKSLDPKLIDEFIDSVNYGVMGLLKLKEQGMSYDS